MLDNKQIKRKWMTVLVQQSCLFASPTRNRSPFYPPIRPRKIHHSFQASFRHHLRLVFTRSASNFLQPININVSLTFFEIRQGGQILLLVELRDVFRMRGILDLDVYHLALGVRIAEEVW